jgi:hypothetical protein
MAGRNTKLTTEARNRLCTAIAAGNYLDAACRSAGITYMTFSRWMKRGQNAAAGVYRELYEAVQRAEAEAEVRMVALWQQACPEDWRAAAEFLARRFPERWARKGRHEVAGADGKPVVVLNVIETCVPSATGELPTAPLGVLDVVEKVVVADDNENGEVTK